MDINSFFLKNSNIKYLNKWIKNDFKNYFLFIHGKDSCGKTSLAECILKSYKIIHINIDFFKEKTSLKEYLDLSLGKKNITMMFNKDIQHNAIIFDNLELFLKHNKNILNDILSYLDKLNIHKRNHPIIFISSNINHKIFKKLLQQCKFIEINYSQSNLESITIKLLQEKHIELSSNEIKDLITKSDSKITNIISNINVINLKDDYSGVYNYEDNFIDDSVKKIYLTKDFTDIIRYSQITNNLYFDILDNIHFMTNDLGIIKNIYKSCCQAENVNTYFIKNHIDLYDLFITLSIIIPKYYLNNEINLKKVINNKYVSKSLIYISNERYLYDNKIDPSMMYLTHKIDDPEFIKFIEEKYNIRECDQKKLRNTYDKIIKFD
tara:strand:- start:924 stop:2060 length:1137 start_codon:yes stop_codon:yes gene_type:complete